MPLTLDGKRIQPNSYPVDDGTVKRRLFLAEEWPNVDVVRVFPMLFTFWSILVFIVPIIKVISLISDPSVHFWIGYLDSRLAVIAPFVFICFGHLLHRAKQVPDKWAVAVSIIASSIVMWFFANRVLQESYYKYNNFIAADCKTFNHKYELEESWQKAWGFYSNCFPSGAYANTTDHQRKLINECYGYEEELAKNSDWRYLQECEETYICSGWCEPGVPLWSRRGPQDPCSRVVADVLGTKVRRLSRQVTGYCMVTGVTAAILIILMGPSFHKHGVQWSFDGDDDA